MFKNIKSTLLLNKKNFDHVEGKRFRYSPQIIWLSAIVLFIAVIMNIIFAIHDPGFLWGGILCSAIFLYILLNMFHKLIFKNPIFIINKNQLFYTKNEKWYDLQKCIVYEEYRVHSYYRALRVTNIEEDDMFEEPYWYIEYDDELKKIIAKYLDKN